MGIGDQLIASGLAREAWTKRGVKIAFGHSGRVIWDKHSSEIFQNNPNVCFPGNEGKQKVEWVPFYKGNRIYNKSGGTHWVWNPDWKSVPGEIYLTHGEKVAGDRAGKGFILIEPNVVRWKSSAANKDWGHHNYQARRQQACEGWKRRCAIRSCRKRAAAIRGQDDQDPKLPGCYCGAKKCSSLSWL
jgi:hypothetical protein